MPSSTSQPTPTAKENKLCSGFITRIKIGKVGCPLKKKILYQLASILMFPKHVIFSQKYLLEAGIPFFLLLWDFLQKNLNFYTKNLNFYIKLYETAHNQFYTNGPSSTNLSPNLQLSCWHSQAIDKHFLH